ncbi:MAG: ATP-binding cassette domain-containing protein [Acidobacteria bacterium]|nr:ATP-binding cassette domain-containing protein [Acidobacteriota bacterium]
MTGVTKTFGRMTAVAELDLQVPRGGLYGFIGPNGAGKTTAIRMIMSILFPDAGDVSVLGHASALEAKDRIGYLPEERGLYKRMKVRPFLRYLARLKGADGPDLDRRIGTALASSRSAATSCRRACRRRCSSSRPRSTPRTC